MILFFTSNCCYTAAKEGEIRLSGSSSTPTYGLLQIYHDNSWGSVCRDGWYSIDSQVACRELGYQTGSGSSSFWVTGEFFGPIYLTDVGCTGDEVALSLCPHGGWGNTDCGHDWDIYVDCTPDYSAEEGDVKLVGGENAWEGILQVFHDQRWGTVCSDNWSTDNAFVVCRQLGYAGIITPNRSFGPGYGPIHLGGVVCTGDEYTLTACSHSEWGASGCTSHEQDVGVECTEERLGEDGNIRLVGGPSSDRGRIEIFHENRWGTICNNNWSRKEALVACRQLGFPGVAISSYYYGPGEGPIYLDEVSCTGSESKLTDCRSRGWGTHTCTHSDDIGVQCSSTEIYEGDLRLVGGTSSDNGRLEIYHDYEWGTICDSSWSAKEAVVACRQLDFPSVSVPLHDYGSGEGPIHLERISCTGTESQLTSCDIAEWGTSNCGHSEDVGIKCSRNEQKEGDLRLVNSALPDQGRLEIFHDYEWGTICDYSWSMEDAEVACRQLGFLGVRSANEFYGGGEGPIHLEKVSCNGSESQLIDCNIPEWGTRYCQHSDDVGIYCLSLTPSPSPVVMPEPRTGMEAWLIAVITVASFLVFGSVLFVVLCIVFSSRKKPKQSAAVSTSPKGPTNPPAPSPQNQTVIYDPTSMTVDTKVVAPPSYSEVTEELPTSKEVTHRDTNERK
ncbi:scavenger receptor cysteine-rich domain-containing group B protein-like [Diadema antillarum]|uniref:scavenger receptor cysteine-rich domain-containing group B protein-like n=1 Tax=Diadema antillarum TaxID=105358 RepID=UPI003A874E4B